MVSQQYIFPQASFLHIYPQECDIPIIVNNNFPLYNDLDVLMNICIMHLKDKMHAASLIIMCIQLCSYITSQLQNILCIPQKFSLIVYIHCVFVSRASGCSISVLQLKCTNYARRQIAMGHINYYLIAAGQLVARQQLPVKFSIDYNMITSIIVCCSHVTLISFMLLLHVAMCFAVHCIRVCLHSYSLDLYTQLATL